jgi:hypothetical protein
MSQNSPALDGVKLDTLYGVEEIAGFIGRSARQTYHLLERGYIPGRKIGGGWISTRKALREALTPDKAA